MTKTITFFLFLCTLQTVFSQNVRFSNGTLENGLSYPIAEFSGDEVAKKTLNQNILEIVSVYKDQDYCISQHGFVQHNNFIQINFYFNCIDLDQSKTESHLFNLSDGETCLPSEMFSKEENGHNGFLHQKISNHYAENGKEAPSNEFMNTLTIDDCEVNLLKAGLEISLTSQEEWPDANLLIPWSELRPYLKHLKSR